MTKKITGYKWISDDWTSRNGNDTPWVMGVWKETIGELKLCQHGYHACHTALQSLGYIYGNRLVVVEAEGDILEDRDKFVARIMRVIKELPAKDILVEFAIACAKNVLYLYEGKYPTDYRPRRAIEAAAAAAYAAYAAAAAAADASATDAAAYAAAAAADAADASATDAAAHAAAAAAAAADASATAAADAADAAAYAAAAAAAAAAARIKERKWQEQKLAQIINKYSFRLEEK